MKIKEICEKTGLTDRTIRYYIEEELIAPFYTENYLGRKSFDFSDQDLEKLKNISTLRVFGFSIEEIKEMSLGDGNNQQIIEAAKKRAEEALDESNRRLNVLSALDLSDAVNFSDLAQKLSNLNLAIENKNESPNTKKRFFSFLGSCAIFLAVWLPIILAIAVLVFKFFTVHTPIVRPVFLIFTLLCFLPSAVALLFFQKIKGARKILRLILISLCVLCIPFGIIFSSKSVFACDHSYETYRIVIEATCKQEGETVMKCKSCGSFKTQKIEQLPHTTAVIKGVAPTCVSGGFSDGEYCSVCDEVLVERKMISSTKIHTPVIDAAVPATCTKTGLTEGSHCSVCKKILSDQIVTPKTSHSYQETRINQSCGVDGCILYTCDCGYSYKTNILRATNEHDFEYKGYRNGYICRECGLDVIAQGKIFGIDFTDRPVDYNVNYYVTGDRQNQKDYEIVIHGIGNMPNFTSEILPPWHNYLLNAKKIVIDEGVTSIGAYSFYCPDNRFKVEYYIANTVKTIKTYALGMKTASIVLGNSVTRIEANGIARNSFEYIGSIYIPRSVTFVDCFWDNVIYVYEGTLEELYSISVSAWNTNMSFKDLLDLCGEEILPNYYFYINASDINDRDQYWH